MKEEDNVNPLISFDGLVSQTLVNSVLWSRTFLPEQGKMHRLQVQADVAVWLGGSVVAESYDNSYIFSQIESKKKYDFKKEKIFHFFTTVFFI